MQLSQLLIDAKELIKDPESWTKGEYARNAAGVKVSDNHPNACQWCTVGALWKASGFLRGYSAVDPQKSSLVNDACELLLQAIGRKRDLSPWNDLPQTTHDDIMNAYNKAIELAYEKEKASN
jgi:hypothetical protein